MAYEYLMANGWRIKTVEKICNCIRAHSAGGEMSHKTIEEKILYDADKLDILGAIGTARIIGYHRERDGTYRSAHNMASIKREASLLREFRQTLKNIPQTLHTKEAKQLAKKKIKTMEQYYNALKKEEKMLRKIELNQNKTRE